MMTARQIFLLFGFFLSMFYIFKYGNVASSAQDRLCQELEGLQIQSLSEITPLIRADASERDFEIKLMHAQKTLSETPDYAARQFRMRNIKRRLAGHTCPAPSLQQIARLAVEN